MSVKRGMALNVRNVPEDVVFAARAKAAMRRQDLREFVIDVLTRETADVRLATFATNGADSQANEGNDKQSSSRKNRGKSQ